MKQIICIASEPWQAIPTRTQQLMARLEDAEVLFFEPPSAAGGNSYKKPGRRVRPDLVVYTLPPILEVEERHRFLFSRNQKKTARFLESKLERHRFREPMLWCTSPMAVHLTEYLSYRGLVYDCDRDWSMLPIRWESDLALAADVVFAASPGLIDHLAPCNDNIALLPNGTNHPMFSKEGLPTPPALQGLHQPMLGYAGTIWRDLDLAPAIQAAIDHPEAVFVFVGKVEKNPFLSKLKALQNVALLGEKPLVELPDYLGRFDVCLEFQRHRTRNSDIIPPRIYEYLSTGKPIVSMYAQEQIEEFPDVIYGANSPSAFSDLCGRALVEIGDWARKRRQTYGAAASWSQRAKEVSRILETIGLC